MMEEIQEPRFVCKFCNKRCLSGKSLGGHMRGHLDLISAARKGRQKALTKNDLEDGDQTEQSNSFLNQEKLKSNDDMELEGGEEEDGYGLRENPKKSWKISDLKHAASRNRIHCKECGKGFPSVRALAGHMRCHPVRKREDFPCKKCKKGFDSLRALFGHMKCHPKRCSDESAESIAEFATVCPIRKKRSRIRYKPSPNLSFSSLNTSSSSFVSETEEVEHVAWCLMMLSRGVRNWDEFNSIMVSSYNNSVTFEADSFDDHYMGVAKIDAGDIDSGETCKKENLSFTGNASSDDVDSGYSTGDEKCELRVSLDASLSSDKLKRLKEEKSEIRPDDVDSRKDSLSGLVKDLIPAIWIDKSDTEAANFDPSKILSSVDHASSLWEETSEEMNYVVAADSEILEAEKTPELKCKTCDKIFDSHQALGGHKDKHNNTVCTSSALSSQTTIQSDPGSTLKRDLPDYIDEPFHPEATKRVITSLEPMKSKEHQCPICFKVFQSGQALGGHKRAHYVGTAERKAGENSKMKLPDNFRNGFRLGLAVTADGGAKDDVDNKLWWTASSHEHEAALVVSN